MPRFLDAPPAFLFFTGKGGVGKTSLACASALRLAEGGARVLLVSTDPASNVAQVFGTPIGDRITTLPVSPLLDALEIDPEASAQAYRARIVGPLRGVLDDAAVRHVEEQLSGACTIEIAAFDRFTALLTDAGLLEHYRHILFDTAPTGHTIRLLQLPGAWSGYLAAGKGDASCLGPLAGLERQREQYTAAVRALSDPSRTRLVMVTRAQHGALREAARTHAELVAIGLSAQHLVVNGVLPATEAATDPLAASICRRERAALEALPAGLRDLPRDDIPLKGFDLVGVAALRRLFDEASASAASPASMPSPNVQPPTACDAPPLATLVDGIERDGHGLVMVVGKGGVGKTTLAAAIAIALADRGHDVHLTTSDPAAHLVDTLAGTRADDADHGVPRLTVDRIDPRAETARYRAHVLATKGAKLDAPARALLEEDLRSPCTEEVAVFHAFSRIIREGAKSFVVMDTAPTGHTLLLLDATGAYHREVVRQMSGSGMRFRTPLMQLQDVSRTKVLVVTLPETTPVLEAAALQADLRRAGIEPWAWIVNDCLCASHPQSPLLRARAGRELAQLAAVTGQHAQRCAVVPVALHEPVGPAHLRALIAPPPADQESPA